MCLNICYGVLCDLDVMGKQADILAGVVARIRDLDTEIANADVAQKKRLLQRKRLFDALKVLREELPAKGGASGGRKDSGKPSSRQGKAPRHEATDEGLGLEPAGTVADAIKAVVLAQPGEFTTTLIVEQLKRHNPEAHRRLPTNYVSTMLWRMTKKGIVRIAKSAEVGGTNTYALAKHKERPAA